MTNADLSNIVSEPATSERLSRQQAETIDGLERQLPEVAATVATMVSESFQSGLVAAKQPQLN